MNELKTHSFKGMSLRSIEKDGEPWFVARDVCAELDIINVSQALGTLDADEHGVCSIYTRSDNGVEQSRNMTIINEAGL